MGGGAGFLLLHLSFSVEVFYVDALSLNNLRFSRLRSWGRKMGILKAALYECSCYFGVIWTFVNSRCWERWGGVCEVGRRWGSLEKVREGRERKLPKSDCLWTRMWRETKTRSQLRALELLGGKQAHITLIGTGGKSRLADRAGRLLWDYYFRFLSLPLW